MWYQILLILITTFIKYIKSQNKLFCAFKSVIQNLLLRNDYTKYKWYAKKKEIRENYTFNF